MWVGVVFEVLLLIIVSLDIGYFTFLIVLL